MEYEYENAVAEFLVANGNTFVARQYNIGNRWSCPDAIAIRPARRECFVVEVSTHSHPKNLVQKVINREQQWFGKLKAQLISYGVCDTTWELFVLLFVRARCIPWFTSQIQDAQDVYLWPLEMVYVPWQWPDAARTPAFSFRQRGFPSAPGPEQAEQS